ncbi:MAG: restriction endonuclease [Chloroflexi bacterium]|nr:restriction endonuclease [Chloroflexota bacterium]
MTKDIYTHIGSPTSQVNWKNPDEWIPQRLNGASRDLALRLWSESDHLVNPRHSYDMRALSGHHKLAIFSADVVQLTQKGERFISGDDAVIRGIDENEGVLFILSEIMKSGLCKRIDLIESFTSYCHTYTTWKAKASIDQALSARFRHLRQRELIERSGHTYEVTNAGLAYLRRVQPNGSMRRSNLTIAELAKRAEDQTRKQLGNFLKKMNPYEFEHLIKRLLEAMNYDNVVVTKQAGDKGVDVEADIKLGISSIHEVIQVKRQKGNIGRPVLDQLRGALHYFNAVRGTIITTGGFTTGAKKVGIVPNVSPITLIDGETLLDLLIEHGIGVRQREIRILEFDEASLNEFETKENATLPSEEDMQSD